MRKIKMFRNQQNNQQGTPPHRVAVPMWIWKVVAGVAVVAGLIVSFITIQNSIDDRMSKEFGAQSTKIINEIHKKTGTLADFQKDDLWDRIQLLELEIDAMKKQGLDVPERKSIHLRSMKERYQEMKNPWAD
jgi:hypothetical protein